MDCIPPKALYISIGAFSTCLLFCIKKIVSSCHKSDIAKIVEIEMKERKNEEHPSGLPKEHIQIASKPSDTLRENFISELVDQYIYLNTEKISEETVKNMYNNFESSEDVKNIKVDIFAMQA